MTVQLKKYLYYETDAILALHFSQGDESEIATDRSIDAWCELSESEQKYLQSRKKVSGSREAIIDAVNLPKIKDDKDDN